MVNKNKHISNEKLTLLTEQISSLFSRDYPEKYPYFQLYYLYQYIQELEHTKDELPASLEKAAVYLNNRKVLFDLWQYLKNKPSEDKNQAETLPQNKNNTTNENPQEEQAQVKKASECIAPMPPTEQQEEKNIKEKTMEELLISESLFHTPYDLTNLAEETNLTGEKTPTPTTFAEWIAFIEHHQKKIKAPCGIKKIEQYLSKIEQNGEKISPPPPQKSFYKPQTYARKSIEENEDFITETLAKIYYQQGNMEKALLAYEKLCLKFPEKKPYFATQINLIKKQLNKK